MPTSGREQEDASVSIDLLSRQFGRYNLVVGVSKRAKDLKERVDSVLFPSSGTLIKRSLREIAEGKVRLFPSTEEREEDGPKQLGSGE